MNMTAQVNDLLLQGFCCSQIIMKLGLVEMKKENDDLVKAMRGLCRGMYAESVCGTLSAASCLLFLFSMQRGQELSQELTGWFKEEFGAVDCPDLLGDDRDRSIRELCPVIISLTIEEVLEMACRRGLNCSEGTGE